ncbi:UvrD-helicase domain-containing protein [Lysobacter sp. M2-1]|uniref:UvrD-helicase domain-containing protein n=1 Tax=Lysobacter sp. M2-1 TaxID=2916839 RepID=UPI001F573635|nr:UvrD-helicase domain-containing protein [Lysobacter sp. M2-1]
MTEADKKIFECLEGRQSFLIDAGAGSGKTSSLVRALDYIRGPERKKLVKDGQRVACITFTNVAKNEIIERTDHDPLFEVSTIHDFLWGAIKPFRKELKPALLTFNAELPDKSRRKQDQAELEEALKGVPSVTYSDRGANFLEGRIYHDDLLGVAKVMFRSHPMLSRVVAARYPFIFVDEYQDTHIDVIEILLDYLMAANPRPLIGFFGDKVQSIYPDGVGELSDARQAQLVIIKKEENYRCSKAVIGILNKVRTDIQQVPAGDNADGVAVYVNLAGIDSATDITDAALAKIRETFGWEIEGELKVLFLTHRLIARKADYEGLWSAYNDRGGFAKERFQAGEDPIAQFLASDIDTVIERWRAGKVGATVALLAKSGKSLASADEKARTTAALDKLAAMAEGDVTIGQVLQHVRETRLLILLDDLEIALSGEAKPAEPETPEAKHQTFMATLLARPYREFSNYHAVLKNHLPYSTKHGVKGDEFQNVLVILDDAGANWNQYSFGNLLAGVDTSDARLKRTRNLFYVCCSRAKDKLIVAHVGDGDRTRMEALFGSEAVAI